jgi:hypothetical protein
MKASNQGFVELHTPAGFMLIGASFIILSILIAVGAIISRKVAVKEREYRQGLKPK